MLYTHILVPTDFRPGSRAALERACDVLGPEGGKVVILHVLDQGWLERTLPLFPETKEADVRAQLRQQAQAQYAQLVQGIEGEKIDCEFLMVEGVPFLKIVQFARDLDVDMIVMAIHRGPESLEQFLFGSTAEHVMRLTPCPVLIVPETVVMHES
jgi:nucleotide-binding universal stress UspA family protein